MAVTVISGFLTERTRAVFGDRVVIPRDDAIAAIPGVRMKGPSADVGIVRPELRQLARQDESSGEVPTVCTVIEWSSSQPVRPNGSSRDSAPLWRRGISAGLRSPYGAVGTASGFT
jgi:hypothetical protein